jgi:hypothetical protein
MIKIPELRGANVRVFNYKTSDCQKKTIIFIRNLNIIKSTLLVTDLESIGIKMIQLKFTFKKAEIGKNNLGFKFSNFNKLDFFFKKISHQKLFTGHY